MASTVSTRLMYQAEIFPNKFVN